jgi:hypothetical protein
MNDEFYIGWADKAPATIGSRVRWAVVLLLLTSFVLGTGLALTQRTIGVSVFEWGKLKEFSGILQGQPYPHLLVPRPGFGVGQAEFSSYYLVNPFKYGLNPQTVTRFDGGPVSLKGTLIYRGNQTMIEVAGDSIKPVPAMEGLMSVSRTTNPVALGRQILIGEIVDSKCYLGVMNPGQLTPHRACAIRCISGGIPPILLVRQTNGSALHFLLVSSDGRPVNKEVLEMVAEPVQITGEVVRQGDLLILRADPATYRRYQTRPRP